MIAQHIREALRRPHIAALANTALIAACIAGMIFENAPLLLVAIIASRMWDQ